MAEDDLDRQAAALVEALANSGALEFVNQRGRKSVVGRVVQVLDRVEAERIEPDQAADLLMQALVDAQEVSEVFADESDLKKLLGKL